VSLKAIIRSCVHKVPRLTHYVGLSKRIIFFKDMCCILRILQIQSRNCLGNLWAKVVVKKKSIEVKRCSVPKFVGRGDLLFTWYADH
jgi:hypothetical protein